MDREKEREMELESAMYTNCLLLGLDPVVIGLGAGNSTPRFGFFRHSNPKLGEQLLYFILSSLRGPVQSAKDFDRVWPIFDSAQSRDFRKVVQGIISDLESQGALPRSNSRVSSLATCCGPRFVELLWQLSLHALREVHGRTFPADVSSNPLPASLTDVAVSHAAALLPVTKARIALERRRFLKNAEMAVQKQAMWSNLAHEMTAEFRGLCAEEAYLQQELEKLEVLKNKAKSEAEMWDDRASGSSQSSELVSKASRLWDSLLSRKGQHEILGSGPIEDLIAHQEHRYRISGTALLAAMDQNTQTLSGQPGEPSSAPRGGNEQIEGYTNSNVEMDISLGSSHLQKHGELTSQAHDRNGRSHPTVDVAEILRRWTHALQRIHKQSQQLAKENDGEGPELLQCAQDVGVSGHADSLAATLSEHCQHLASMQVLNNQLKEVAPGMQNSITKLAEEVNCISSSFPPMNNSASWSASPMHAQSSGRTMDGPVDEVAEVTRKMSYFQLEKAGASPTLKLPPLFSLTPNSSGKGGNVKKRRSSASSQTHLAENISDSKSLDNQSLSNTNDNLPQENGAAHVLNLKRSVRATALSVPLYNSETSRESLSEDGSEHFFVPISSARLSHLSPEKKQTLLRSERFFSEGDGSFLSYHTPEYCVSKKADESRDVSHKFESLREYENIDAFHSPPLLMETSLLADCFEDLLAPLSEMDTALMDH